MRSAKKHCPRRLPCEVCGTEVEIHDRERYLRLVRNAEQVCCEQCGRYVLPGTARKSQLPTEHVVTSLGLREKRGGSKGKLGSLEKLPLGRMGKGVCGG